MGTERIEFARDAGHRLAGRLETPDGPARATALFAHCFTCGKDVRAAARITRRLAAAGIATLRFDFTGLGDSDGAFEDTGFDGDVADLVAAGRHLGGLGMAPGLVIGHSLGGAAAISAGSNLGVRGVVTINAPSDVSHILHHLGDGAARAEAEGRAEVVLAGRPFTVGRQFIEQARGAMLIERVKALRAALLVLHAPTDQTVGIDNARILFEAARHPKSFVALDRADHLLTGDGDADYAADLIVAWAGRYF